MKGGIAAAAMAAMATGANAINHRHAHELFAAKRGAEVEKTCGCTTIYTTITGEPTLVPVAPPTSTPVVSATPIPPAPVAPAPEPTSTSVHVPLPTDEPISCPTPGTYTFPATTVTVTDSTTVCVGTSTHVTPGTHTVGGVTTIVETATTITCPVATTVTDGDVVHSTITDTVYVCPTPGTYTIAPITTTVTEECDIEYPVPTSYAPGTYTAPELVLTVTETGFVTVCPYTSSETAAPEPTVAPSPIPQPPQPSPEVPEPSPEPSPAPEPTTSAAPEPSTKPSPKPSKPSNGGFDGSLGTDGDHYGITYTPYDGATGECKDASKVEKDISNIKKDGFDLVRVYSTDCDTIDTVAPACKKHGVRMIVGVFVKDSGCSYDTPEIKEQVDTLASWADWDMVDLFVVGNEAIMNSYCTAQELATLITTVKSKTGYPGSFSTAETLNIWQRTDVSGALCDVVDFTGANIHPYFNPDVSPIEAGDFVEGQIDLLDNICPGKKAINLECGWPKEGNGNGLALPGLIEQSIALASIRSKVGGKTVFFSYEDDEWKEPGSCNCEKSWGCASYFTSLL
jgi:exo-beta-1,3-glucanase (GH17 family)